MFFGVKKVRFLGSKSTFFGVKKAFFLGSKKHVFWLYYRPQRLKKCSPVPHWPILGGPSVTFEKKYRTKHCAFCKRRSAMYKCRSCGAHLCMKRPQAVNGITFPINGPHCFIRYHGVNNYTSVIK